MDRISTIHDLKREYYRKHPDGHFFDPDTLKFFGERLSEMRLLKNTKTVTDILGEKHECYVISCVRHDRPTPGRHRHYHYIDTETLDNVIL